MTASITNFGGRIVSLWVPDKDGQQRDVVLGFDKLEDYLPENNRSDFGAVIGRYANRLNNGQITIDGRTYQLPQNDGANCLHGGPDGWQYRMFNVESVSYNRLVLSLVSEDGDSGFPGNVCVRVTYTLTDDNALNIEYEAVTDSPTVINMTNHSYFNLNGDASTDILNHLLSIDANRYTPIDESFIPTGELASVDDTPMDFRQAKTIGRNIAADFEQLRIGRGYDHNWVLNTQGDDSHPCARLESPMTGIAMEVFTTEPGMEVYTGNFLDGSVIGKNGIPYQQRSAICLETQKFPDSPNQHWPESNAFLRPGETYRSRTAFKFSTLVILLCFFLMPFISSAQGKGQAELLEKAYISDSYELLYQFFDNWHHEINPTDAKSVDPWVAEAHKIYDAMLTPKIKKKWGFRIDMTVKPFLILQSKIDTIAYIKQDKVFFKKGNLEQLNYIAVDNAVAFRPKLQVDGVTTVYLTDGYDELLKNFQNEIIITPAFFEIPDISEEDSVLMSDQDEFPLSLKDDSDQDELPLSLKDNWEKLHFMNKYINNIDTYMLGWRITPFFSIDQIIFDPSRKYAIVEYRQGKSGGTIVLEKIRDKWTFMRTYEIWLSF